MAQTVPNTITSLPPAPTVADPSTFDTRADAIMAAWPLNISETNAVATVTYDNAVDAYNNANVAATKAAEAMASASTAQAISGSAAWVSGTTYAEGDVRYSLIDYTVYRRRTAGGGTTDPKLDPDNWALAAQYRSLHAMSLFYATSF